MENINITVNVTFEGDKSGSFQLESNVPDFFESLAQRVQESFGIRRRANLTIKYVDNDDVHADGTKDLIAVDSAEELQEALSAAPKNEQGAIQLIAERKRKPRGGKMVAHRRQALVAKMQAGETKYSEQLRVLGEKGFECKRRNILLLTRFDGNVEKVMAIYEKHQNKRNTFRQALTQLEAMGFTKQRGKIIAALRKTQGDVDAAAKLLVEADIEKEQKDLENKKQEAEPANAVEQLNAIFGPARNEEKRNLRFERLLKKFDGDVQKVVAFLNEKKAAKSVARENSHAARRAKILERKQQRLLHKEGKKAAKKCAHAEVKAAEYPAQLATLTDMGFGDRPKRNVRLLQKFDGNVEQVVAVLSKRRQRLQTGCNAHCKKQATIQVASVGH